MGIDRKRRLLLQGRNLNENVIRMPWVKKGTAFTDMCTRCEKCIDVCPSSILQVADGGFPEVNFSHGECFFCTDCINCCSVDMFDLEQDNPWTVKATISTSCLNNQTTYCRSCAESCGSEALLFEFSTSIFVSPIVANDTCTGCGACISNCPVDAIRMKADVSC